MKQWLWQWQYAGAGCVDQKSKVVVLVYVVNAPYFHQAESFLKVDYIKANWPEEKPVAQILVQLVTQCSAVPVKKVFWQRVLYKRRGLRNLRYSELLEPTDLKQPQILLSRWWMNSTPKCTYCTHVQILTQDRVMIYQTFVLQMIKDIKSDFLSFPECF